MSFRENSGDSSRVGQNIAPAGALQNDGNPGSGRALVSTNVRNVDPALLQSLQRDLSELIIANQGLESNAAAQRRQIVGDDRG